MSVAEELRKLQQLREAGAINDDEFALAKEKLLNKPPPIDAGAGEQAQLAINGPAAVDQQTRQWAMFLHLSLLAGFLVPFAGLLVPIVIWQLKKEELPGIDAHGKIAVNWIISAILYAVVCILLVFVIVGIPLLIALGTVGIIFPIVGGINANNGKVWRYPLSITFLK
ncbi:MAG TPA: DUF4870 domain-containing protein [Phycisphaerae bacterium]|nr:DUF4870 domain-containing protein [Phycisphaerae bacterium]